MRQCEQAIYMRLLLMHQCCAVRLFNAQNTLDWYEKLHYMGGLFVTFPDITEAFIVIGIFHFMHLRAIEYSIGH